MLPVYSALHLIPALVLRRHNFQRAPLRMLAKVVWGIVRSCSFLGGFVVIYQCEWGQGALGSFGYLCVRV